MSRRLPVSDPDRSVAFYRDVLGFHVRDAAGDGDESVAAEVVHGRARIRFVVDAAPAEGRRVVFFATDEVEEMRAAVSDHGGTPSAVEEVNGVKLRVFQVQDPDGHTLWFGQSFDAPDAPRPEG